MKVFKDGSPVLSVINFANQFADWLEQSETQGSKTNKLDFVPLRKV